MEGRAGAVAAKGGTSASPPPLRGACHSLHPLHQLTADAPQASNSIAVQGGRREVMMCLMRPVGSHDHLALAARRAAPARSSASACRAHLFPTAVTSYVGGCLSSAPLRRG